MKIATSFVISTAADTDSLWDAIILKTMAVFHVSVNGRFSAVHRGRTGALVRMTASITGWIVSLGVAASIALRQSTSILTSLTSDDEILAVSLILVAVAAVMGTTGAMFG